MRNLVEDFLQHLRNERGQSENTQRTYAALLNKFLGWAEREGISAWSQVKLSHLMNFLKHERERNLEGEEQHSKKRLSSESVYLEIAALRV